MRATRRQKAHRSKFAKAAKKCSKLARLGHNFRLCMKKELSK